MVEKLDINMLIDISETLAKDLKAPLKMSVHEAKTRPEDFKILKNLAKGGYGEVYVVERLGKVYAMKKVAKSLIMRNLNTTFFMNEKDIMTSHSIEWLVKSYLCVQDEAHIYYIMDFIHGGDLMGYLSKIDMMKENEIRFYGAEILTAINEMHKIGWIHRDLKPDNILIDKLGHVKLADFGSCTKLVNGKVYSSTTVGTPDYVSPDVLSSLGETVVYGPGVDFWTVGVILYEMFYGTTPFYSESLKLTYSKINSIDFVFEDGISENLKDLIEHLLCPSDRRYGYDDVKKHKFFEGICWESLRDTEPPFKPQLSGEEDISNFVDTEFEPDTYITKCGFQNFIGFTHDPEHCNRILRSILRTVPEDNPCLQCSTQGIQHDGSASNKGTISTSHGIFHNTDKGIISSKNGISTKQSLLHNTDKDPIPMGTNGSILNTKLISFDIGNSLESEIVWKKKELVDLQHVLEPLSKEKEEKEALISAYNTNLQQIIDQIVFKKDDLDQLKGSIFNAKEELNTLKNAISEKMKSLIVSSSTKMDSGIQYSTVEGLRDIKKMIERFKFTEQLDLLQKDAYWLYKQNQYLLNEIKILNQNENGNKSVDDLKKQLRMQKNEIKEYEQKVDQEIIIRKKLEEEIKGLKKALKESSRIVNNFTLPCINAMNNKETQIVIENNTLRIDGYVSILNNLYVRELKNNEMHHLSYKKRALCIQMHFLNEAIKCSSSSGTRRSLKALESDLDKENKMLKGLEDLLKVLTGKTREEAELQKNGSVKKIEQLKEEIERAKKSTISENMIDDNEKVYEFNNHLFYVKTVAKGTLCDHCNEVLYGIVNQAFCCKDCLLVVHKSCYVLIDTSCELNRAIQAGTSIPVVCRTNEDKEKLLNLNKAM